jgi:dihydropteroate synthase
MMGVLNVTSDSFSDGGRWTEPHHAVEHGLAMRSAGADIVDVGGESTRPGAHRVSAGRERGRVIPVIGALAAAGVVVSVDTTRSDIAEAALEAGAVMVNDVSGGEADPNMVRVVRDAGCPWVLMHNRGPSDTMRDRAHYHDVVSEVRAELSARVDAALAMGVSADAIVVDPGLGFAKAPAHNWMLLDRLDAVRSLGFPVLVGASRKSFLGSLLADREGQVRPVADREDATAAVTTYAALAGAWGVRVHEVRRNVDAALTAMAIHRAAQR